MRPIDADALLEKFTKLEAIALKYVGELNKRQDPNERDEWLMWTGILNERTAYKYEIVDAPTIDAVPVRHAKLLNAHPYGECSNCGYLIDIREGFKYCPNCGADMREVEE